MSFVFITMTLYYILVAANHSSIALVAQNCFGYLGIFVVPHELLDSSFSISAKIEKRISIRIASIWRWILVESSFLSY